ncbi:MAG: DUF4255 domain-containing protein [Williamsia sp.]|nr:DUF4255 domain-containing protein [Williamsia sp.]
MSTALAIASVTQVLKDLLNNGLIDHDATGTVGGNVKVTALPPDRVDTEATKETSQLNLFMYMVTPNLGWRNQGLPSRNSGGDRISNPPLALDLHYLLTAYGSEELHHEILLGYGMQLFHEVSVLSRQAIRTALSMPDTTPSGTLPSHLVALSTSELADQIEQIKITPESLNTEELSRLWTAFGAKYRPNAAYKVTVVLIESKKSTRPSLPVQERKIYVVPFKQPVIEKIASQHTPGGPFLLNGKILWNDRLVLQGNQLRGDVVIVNIDGTEIVPAANEITDSQITIGLPGLQAGIHGLQVVHKMLMGSPPLPHQGVSSNVEAFVLSPHIEALHPENVQGTGGAPRSADVHLSIKPGLRAGQRVILLLNEFPAPVLTTPLSYSFQGPPIILLSPPLAIEDIVVPVSGIRAGTYLVRIRVDGAESPLDTDASFQYNAPQLTIA